MILLDYISIDSTIVYVFCFIVVVMFIALIASINTYKTKANTFEKDVIRKDGELSLKGLELEKIISDSKGYANEIAAKQFQQWKDKELIEIQKAIEKSELDKANIKLRVWLMENEERIRKDAANRSVRNVLGKVTEHLIPFSEAMSGFNPRDIRFIGSPIDLIIFDGAEELKKDEVQIVFVEVKTGTSALSKRQQLIKDAIQNRRIKWMRVSMKDFGDDVNEALNK